MYHLQKQKLYQTIQLARINPQFIGIGHELESKKKHKKIVQLDQEKVANRVSFLYKEQVNANKTLQRKNKQFETLIAKLNRKREEQQEVEIQIIQKNRLRQKRQNQITRLREENNRRRYQSEENKRNSLLSCYNQNHSFYQQVKNTLTANFYAKKNNKLKQSFEKKTNVLSISLGREKGRQKINTFYKTRNDSFTKSYKEEIQHYENEAERRSSEIKKLTNEKNEIKMKLEDSSSKISQVHEQIAFTYKQKGRTMNTLLNNSSFYDKLFIMKRSAYKTEDEKDSSDTEAKLREFIDKETNDDAS